jgi:putative transposase
MIIRAQAIISLPSARTSNCHLFGQIVEGEMDLNDIGQMVQSIWIQMTNHYPNCQVDAFVVLPNHVHGIIVIEPGAVAEPDGGAGRRARPVPTNPQRNYYEHIARNHDELQKIREKGVST